MANQTYTVKRQMLGDKQYFAGDERVMDEVEAAPLVARGLLKKKRVRKAPQKPKRTRRNKSETPPPNKSEEGADGAGDAGS